jgi:hypothetical protein
MNATEEFGIELGAACIRIEDKNRVVARAAGLKNHVCGIIGNLAEARRRWRFRWGRPFDDNAPCISLSPDKDRESQKE